MELLNNRDGFCFVGCVCELGGVYVGVWLGQEICVVLDKVL